MTRIVRAGYGRPGHAAILQHGIRRGPNSMPLHMGQVRSAPGRRRESAPAPGGPAARQISTQLWVLTVDGMELSVDTGVPPETRVRSWSEMTALGFCGITR